MNIQTFIHKTLVTTTLVFSAFTYANTISDSDIESAIKQKLASDAVTTDLSINISSQNGVVDLSGVVNTDKEASRAIELAESVNGVKDVNDNQLKVKDSDQPLSDAAITAKVKGTFAREKLFGDSDIAVISINVETKNGVVFLTGTANARQQIDNAIKLAKTVKGVRKVVSKVTIQR